MERSDPGLLVSPAWVRDLVFVAGAALTIGLLGPYGSWDEPLEHRMVRSFALGFAAYWIWPVMRIALRASARASIPPIVTTVAGLAILTLPVCVTSFVVASLFNDGGPRRGLFQFYFPILAMVLPVGLAYLYVDQWIERTRLRPAEAPPAAARLPRFLSRLPPNLGREILALQAEDHYVRVHTRSGSTLILMRLADAIAELDGMTGLRVHRSWWVAEGAVASGRTEGRRAVLTLANGAEAPVTREAVPEVRRAGWL